MPTVKTWPDEVDDEDELDEDEQPASNPTGNGVFYISNAEARVLGLAGTGAALDGLTARLRAGVAFDGLSAETVSDTRGFSLK